MPTAAVIAIAVVNAPTRTEVLRRDATKLFAASIASTPSQRPSALAIPAQTPDTSDGMANAAAAIMQTADA
jgi:hypothetical protein